MCVDRSWVAERCGRYKLPAGRSALDEIFALALLVPLLLLVLRAVACDQLWSGQRAWNRPRTTSSIIVPGKMVLRGAYKRSTTILNYLASLYTFITLYTLA